jgi:hypothetical protein
MPLSARLGLGAKPAQDGVHLSGGGAILFAAFPGRPTAHQTDGRSHSPLPGTSAEADAVKTQAEVISAFLQ